MATVSKREFIKSCLSLSVSAAYLLAGCNGRGQQPAATEDPASSTEAETRPKRTAQIDPGFEAPYLRLHKSGELKKRADELWSIMESCELCPRRCGVNKLEGNKGFCQADSQLQISAYRPHFGEERPLVGKGGSGTIFLTNCGLRCVFCCNWQISQGGQGEDRAVEDMADMMLRLQERGCHNINFVTPTHYSPHIVRAVDIAAGKGLRLPLVYNTCGWEREEILKMLDGIVDVYLPDFKYADGEMAAKYSSGAEAYPEVTKAALLEMHRQVGVAKPAKDGLMYRGLMIRHLVMPNRVSGAKEVFRWIGENLPKDTYLNIMAQYTPLHKASEYPKIARRLTREEFVEAVQWATEAGLTNLDIQPRLLL
jgi:putative pyruvate formate lyase activating enzyme